MNYRSQNTFFSDHSFISGDGGIKPENEYNTTEENPEITILGPARINPYSVEKMTNAWNLLYGDNIPILPKTHTYIKISPQNDDDLIKIDEYEDNFKIPIFDFPLENEVLKMGDYYVDPLALKPELTFLYASVPKDKPFPNVTYQIVSDLVIPPYLSHLTYTSFMLTGNNYTPSKNGGGDGGGGSSGTTIPTIPGLNFPPTNGCTPQCPCFPSCLRPWRTCNGPCGNGTHNDPPRPRCMPNSPHWPDCLDLDVFPEYDPTTGDPTIGDPTVQDPPLNDPTTGDPTTGDPTIGDPTTGDPTHNFPNGGGDMWCECIEEDILGNIVNRYLVETDENGNCPSHEDYGNYSISCSPYSPPPPPPPTVITNGCGCPVYANERKPAGCVKVLNNSNISLEGVKQANIKIKDSWFTADYTYTDNAGCWKINKPYSGKAWLTVRFRNPSGTVRALRWNPLHMIRGVYDYAGVLNGPRFNNINIEYRGSNDLNSNDQMYWVAATTLNALNEYNNNPDGIPQYLGLNILLFSGNTGTGGAPMLKKGTSVFTIIADLIMIWSLGPYAPVALVVAHTIAYPDITYSYGTLSRSTNRVKNVMYHEFAHASHHLIVGDGHYDKLRLHIVSNSFNGDVYGFPGAFAIGSSPQFVAVAEGWAYHYGDFLAGRGGESGSLESEFRKNGFIPHGLGNDLNDPRRTSDPSGYNDGVLNFTNSQYFNALRTSFNMTQLRNVYINSYLIGGPNTNAQVNSLFANYDF